MFVSLTRVELSFFFTVATLFFALCSCNCFVWVMRKCCVCGVRYIRSERKSGVWFYLLSYYTILYAYVHFSNVYFKLDIRLMYTMINPKSMGSPSQFCVSISVLNLGLVTQPCTSVLCLSLLFFTVQLVSIKPF